MFKDHKSVEERVFSYFLQAKCAICLLFGAVSKYCAVLMSILENPTHLKADSSSESELAEPPRNCN